MTKKRAYNALFVIIFSVSLGFSIIHPFLPVYIKGLGGSGIDIAFIFTGYYLSKIIFTPLFGTWSDRRRKRYFIVTGLAMYILISLAYFSLPTNLIFLILLRLAQGIGATLVRPLAQAYIGDMSKNANQGALMGTFDISFYMALAMGPIIGGILNDLFGFSGIFLSLLICCLLSFIIALAYLIFNQLPLEPADNKVKLNYTIIIENRLLMGLFGFIFTRSFGVVLLPIFLPVFMKTQLNSSNIEIGIIAASGSIIIAALLRPMGKLADKINRENLVVFGGGMTYLFILLLPFSSNFMQLLIFTALIGLFSALSIPASYALLVKEGKPYGMGLTMGLFNSFMNTGFLMAPIMGGVMMDILGLKYVFFAAGSLGISGLFFFWFLCSLQQTGCQKRYN